MFNIQHFFERFKSRELDEIVFRSAVIDAVREVLQFELDPLVISYSNNVIRLNISPAAKSAVMVKKKELLEKIRGKTNRKALDIK